VATQVGQQPLLHQHQLHGQAHRVVPVLGMRVVLGVFSLCLINSLNYLGNARTVVVGILVQAEQLRRMVQGQKYLDIRSRPSP